MKGNDNEGVTLISSSTTTKTTVEGTTCESLKIKKTTYAKIPNASNTQFYYYQFNNKGQCKKELLKAACDTIF